MTPVKPSKLLPSSQQPSAPSVGGSFAPSSPEWRRQLADLLIEQSLTAPPQLRQGPFELQDDGHGRVVSLTRVFPRSLSLSRGSQRQIVRRSWISRTVPKPHARTHTRAHARTHFCVHCPPLCLSVRLCLSVSLWGRHWGRGWEGKMQKHCHTAPRTHARTCT